MQGEDGLEDRQGITWLQKIRHFSVRVHQKRHKRDENVLREFQTSRRTTKRGDYVAD